MPKMCESCAAESCFRPCDQYFWRLCTSASTSLTSSSERSAAWSCSSSTDTSWLSDTRPVSLCTRHMMRAAKLRQRQRERENVRVQTDPNISCPLSTISKVDHLKWCFVFSSMSQRLFVGVLNVHCVIYEDFFEEETVTSSCCLHFILQCLSPSLPLLDCQ